jgi:hypothetical protein
MGSKTVDDRDLGAGRLDDLSASVGKKCVAANFREHLRKSFHEVPAVAALAEHRSEQRVDSTIRTIVVYEKTVLAE